jgi:hypothetical protein
MVVIVASRRNGRSTSRLLFAQMKILIDYISSNSNHIIVASRKPQYLQSCGAWKEFMQMPCRAS